MTSIYYADFNKGTRYGTFKTRHFVVPDHNIFQDDLQYPAALTHGVQGIGTEVDNDGTAISLAGALKLLLSLETGKVSGGGTTTITFRDTADTKDVLVATVDGYGNRSAIGTRDAT